MRISKALALRAQDVDLSSTPPRVRVCGTLIQRSGIKLHRQDYPKAERQRKAEIARQQQAQRVAPPQAQPGAVQQQPRGNGGGQQAQPAAPAQSAPSNEEFAEQIIWNSGFPFEGWVNMGCVLGQVEGNDTHCRIRLGPALLSQAIIRQVALHEGADCQQ